MREVPVGRSGLVGLVDDADYDLVSKYRWHVQPVPNSDRVYARHNWYESGRRRTQRMHNLITGWPLVDHIDHNGLNNQRSNLRLATNQQNQHNRRPNRLSGRSVYKGVCWRTSEARWVAKIQVNGKRIHLGYFDDEVEAAAAYDAAALEHFGEFAWLNFPSSKQMAVNEQAIISHAVKMVGRVCVASDLDEFERLVRMHESSRRNADALAAGARVLRYGYPNGGNE